MLKQYLQQICQELGIDSKFELSAEGFYSIPFEQNMHVRFKENEDNTVYLQSECAPLPKAHTEEYLTLIMKAHLFGKETGRSFFGLDGKEENILISQLLSPRLSFEEFCSELEDYLNYLESWREETRVFGKPKESEKKAS